MDAVARAERYRDVDVDPVGGVVDPGCRWWSSRPLLNICLSSSRWPQCRRRDGCEDAGRECWPRPGPCRVAAARRASGRAGRGVLDTCGRILARGILTARPAPSGACWKPRVTVLFWLR